MKPVAGRPASVTALPSAARRPPASACEWACRSSLIQPPPIGARSAPGAVTDGSRIADRTEPNTSEGRAIACCGRTRTALTAYDRVNVAAGQGEPQPSGGTGVDIACSSWSNTSALRCTSDRPGAAKVVSNGGNGTAVI